MVREYTEEQRARRNAAVKAWNKRNPEYKRAWDRANYPKVKDKSLAYCKEWRSKHKEKGRAYNWSKKYGITPTDYQRLLDKQGGVCAMCRKPPLEAEFLAVDHDHESHVVRGLLHRTCNTALGLLGDNPVSAASQLARYACMIGAA